MLQWPFPWRRDWNIQNLGALITGECGTSQLSQLYLHTCRKMLSTRLTGSSSHLRFTLDHEKVLHSKQRESSPRRQRERDLNTQFGTKMATRPNSWNLFSWFRNHKNGSKIQGYHWCPNRSFLFPQTSFTMVGPSQLRLGSSVMAQRFRRRSMAFISWSCRITKWRRNHPLQNVWQFGWGANFLLRGWEVNVLSWYPIWNRRILVATSQHTGEGIWHSRFSNFSVGRV